MTERLTAIDQELVLLAGGVILVVVALILIKFLRRSSWARVRRALKDLATRKRDYETAARAARKAREKVAGLRAKSDRVKPKKLWQAEEDLARLVREAQRARDEVKVAERELRRTIEAEYPPPKQEQLFRKYLPEDDGREAPFRF